MIGMQIQSNVLFAEQIWAVTISQTFASMHVVERKKKHNWLKHFRKERSSTVVIK